MLVPIPSDWDGVSYCYKLLCWPSSAQWNAVLLGQLTALARGRFWDEKTGSIVDTQELVRQIISENTDSTGEIMGCNDLILVLQQIATGIANIEAAQVDISVSNDATAIATAQSAAAQVEVNNNIISLSYAVALSQAWAESMAVATASVEVVNNVNITIGSVSPVRPPVATQATATGISTTPTLPASYCDASVYIVDSAIQWFKNLQDLSAAIGSAFVSGFYGIVGESFTALELFGLPVPPTPATLLAILAGELYAWALKGVFESNRTLGREWLESNRELLICLVYQGAINAIETGLIREAIQQEMEIQDVPSDVASVILSLFHPSIMALLYYVSPSVTLPTTTFDCTDCLA